MVTNLINLIDIYSQQNSLPNTIKRLIVSDTYAISFVESGINQGMINY